MRAIRLCAERVHDLGRAGRENGQVGVGRECGGDSLKHDLRLLVAAHDIDAYAHLTHMFSLDKEKAD